MLCVHVAGGVGAVRQWGLEVGVQEEWAGYCL